MPLPPPAPLGAQEPRLLVRPESPFSSADDVRDLALAYGLTLDPWQHNLSAAFMGEREDGRWATPLCGTSVPRQNGKNGWVEARELAGLLLFGERLIIHSAHEVKTALEAFRRIRSYFDNYDDLRKRVKAIRTTNGDEGIELLSGQRLRFMARSKSSGRGFSPDALILDEAQELAEETFAAILPATSARPNPQIILLGTPPGPRNNGEVFTRLRLSALAGKDATVAWAEWSADDDLDHDDVAALAQGNPSLGIRLTEETASRERAALSDDDYARERLGKWDAEAKRGVIPLDVWATLASDQPTSEREVSIALDAAPDRSTASVALAGWRDVDSRPQVEVIRQAGGVAWVADYVAGVVSRQRVRAVIVDSVGPAASLIEPLRARGVLVTTTSASQVAQACGAFYDAAMADSLRHIDQPQLTTALAAARKRNLGDAWAWHRKDSTDISPLVASTLALWGLTATTIAQPKTVKAPKVSTAMYGFS
jgi:hypothetical protein